MMALICYDGSADAQAAIDRAAQLMPGSHATVLVVWETMLESMTRNGSLGMGMGLAGLYGDDDADTAIETAALDSATEGAQRADAAGLVAEPRVAKRDEDIAAVIVAAASDVEADVIVLGTRGRGDVKSLLLGSVSNAVVHHADRPVLIVPSPALTEERQRADPTRVVAGISPSDRDEAEHHGQHIT
jgi:nucleotide-binding universal stress UspA family protein